MPWQCWFVVVLLNLAGVIAHELPNRRPHLKPLSGAWRGATHYGSFADYSPSDFVNEYGVPLHIYRSFKTVHDYWISEHESSWIRAGGILFYSIQPSNWSIAASASFEAAIANYAAAVKSVAPAQVMVVVGFEPDGHAAETQPNASEVLGNAAEYRAMWRSFVRGFQDAGVTNMVWVMDFSCNIRKHAWVAKELWPGDDTVSWLFFNVFQKKAIGKDGGNCSDMLHSIYTQLEEGAGAGNQWKSIPWGLGAWGTMQVDFVGEPVPTKDRRQCLHDMRAALEHGWYPNLQAAIYFDSLSSAISPRNSSQSPELVPAFEQYLRASPFTANDEDIVVV